MTLESFIEEVFKMPIFGPIWALGPKKGGTYKIKILTSRAEARPVPCPFYLKPVQYYPTFYLITTEGIQSNSNMTQMAI